MSGVARRDIGPLLQRIRAFLLGVRTRRQGNPICYYITFVVLSQRHHTNSLRFEDGLSDRTTNPPELPDGCAHKYVTIGSNCFRNLMINPYIYFVQAIGKLLCKP